ncbi:hypothetical protein [Streptomyces sp. NPDC047999]|uniref:hypothetical protein n=1 Tax=Streptomyces sp. NPDC047999 TaxID=3365497 RepID=UPI003713F596
MARTAHHIRSRRAGTVPPGHRPWRRVVLRDLRFSTHAAEEAERRGVRVRPASVLRTVEVRTFLRSRDDRGISAEAGIEERRARARCRDRLRLLLGVARSLDGPLNRAVREAADGHDDFDIPPVRHRHGVLR